MLSKPQLRQQQKNALTSLADDSRQSESQQLYRQLYQTDVWQTAHTVAITLNLPFELNTQPIIQTAWQTGKRVVVPKISGREMGFVEINEQTRYQSGSLNILDPLDAKATDLSTIDLAVIPGLAFSEQGDRLGFGGGFYDRFLATFQGQSIALALSTQLLTDLPTEVHDQRVQQVLTV